jgi:hypothetical protein
MYEAIDTPRPGIVGIRVSGSLSEDDYRTLVPWLEREIDAHGTIRVLALLEGFHGWDSVSAAWTDIKMDFRLTPHVDRLAMVGDKQWEKWLTELSDPFFSTKMRWFERDQLDEAQRWVADGCA